MDGTKGDALTPGSMRPRSAEDFDLSYKATPAWDIGHPQPAFVALAASGAIRGRVLDVGCGTGEHALMAAEMGLTVTGIDAASKAIAVAGAKAKERGLSARFLVCNVLELPTLKEQFDTTLDCGLFHVLGDDDRQPFADGLAAVLRPGGRHFMLCFSDLQPGRLGPRRISQAEIRTCFNKGWRVDSIEPSNFALTINPSGAVAWLASITRA